MIVGTDFEGDENQELKRKQHDAYPRAIGLMINICNSFSNHAIIPKNIGNSENWGRINTCDHRTIQAAHDMLAAAYRFEHDARPKDPNSSGASLTEKLWLDWLFAELVSWKESPALIQYFQIILTNQNQPDGYVAESRICLGILDRFPDVPWGQNWRDAFKNDLARYVGAIPLSETRH